MITVVSAAIVAPTANRILLTQRCGSSYPFLWCTPGGHVEPNEEHIEALGRELIEEIGWTSALFPFKEVYVHTMQSSRTGEPVKVHCYLVKHYGELDGFSCLDKTIGVGWFDTPGLFALRDARMLTPADEANVDALAALVRP